MRKLRLIYLLFLLPFGANAQWIGGATTQGIFSGNKQIRWNFGTSGFVYGYTKGQIDSLFSTATGSVSSVFGRTGAITAQAGDYAAFYAPIASGAGYIPYVGATATFNRNQQDITGSFTGAGITHSDLLSTGSWAQNVHDLTSTYSLSSDFQPQRTMHSNVPNGVLANTVYTSFGLDNAFTSAQIESNIPFKFKTPFVGLITARGTYGALEYLPKQRIDSLLTPKITLTSLSANSPLIYNNTNGTFSIQLAGSAQPGYLSSTDWNIFNNKEPSITAGTTLQFWRGDKTFQTLNTAVVPELTNLYYTNARGIGSTLTGYVSGAGTVSASDNILQAIQKLNGNIGGLITGVSSFNSRTGAVIPVAGDYSSLTETLTGKTISGASNTITNVPISTGISGLGTGIATALAINTGSSGAPVLFNGAGGTPSSIILTNGSGTAAALNIGGNAATATSVGSSITFNNGGAGVASGTAYNGSVARIISYNTVGAAPASSSANYINQGASAVNQNFNLGTGTGTATGFTAKNTTAVTGGLTAQMNFSFADGTSNGFGATYNSLSNATYYWKQYNGALYDAMTLNNAGNLYLYGNAQIGSGTATAGAEKLQVTGAASISTSLSLGTTLTLTTTPTASVGGFEFLTRNTTTGIIEKTTSPTATIDATLTSYSMIAGTRYVSDNASLITFTLPATATVGQIFIITGGVSGTGLWKIAQNSGQTIHGATNTTTGTGGSVTATGQYNSIQIVCVKANTDFTVQSSQGSLTII